MRKDTRFVPGRPTTATAQADRDPANLPTSPRSPGGGMGRQRPRTVVPGTATTTTTTTTASHAARTATPREPTADPREPGPSRDVPGAPGFLPSGFPPDPVPWLLDATPDAGQPAPAASTVSPLDPTSFDVKPVEEQDGHFSLVLPAPWQHVELVRLIEGPAGWGRPARQGIHRVWLQQGELHAQGRRAGPTLNQLRAALILLRRLGVGSPDLPDFLAILHRVPALMVLPRALGVDPAEAGGGVSVHGDREWLSCVLAQLTVACPPLACRLFVHLTPALQSSLLRRCPTTVSALVPSLTNVDDQQALTGCFEQGLAAELRSGAPASRLLCWIEHCPPWAAASLRRIWDGHPVAADRTWWLHGSPELGEALAALTDVARPWPPLGLASGWPGADTDPPGGPSPASPDEVLAALRAHGHPWEGSPPWLQGMALIRRQIGQILSATPPEAAQAGYACIIEALNLLKCADPGALLMHTALTEVAGRFEARQVQDDRLDWLLDRLSRGFARGFAQAAGHAFHGFCAAPEVPTLFLQGNRRGALAAVPCADTVHLRWLLAAMVRHAAEHPAFQARGLLGLTQVGELRTLLGPDVDLVQLLAPQGLLAAHWRVQYLLRDTFVQALAQQSPAAPDEPALQRDVLAGVLQGASIDQEVPVRPEEVALMASLISNAEPSTDLVDWLASVVLRYPQDPAYQKLVATLILEAAGRLYLRVGHRKAEWLADELIAMLCREDVAIDADFRLLGGDVRASPARTETTLIRWIKRTRGTVELGQSAPGQRACAWMVQWVAGLDPRSMDEERLRLIEFVRVLRRRGDLSLLSVEQRGLVAIWLVGHESRWAAGDPG